MPSWGVIVAVPFAWLLGTFPTAVLVARSRGHDISKEGSGNPGASNVGRILGPRAFALVFAVDLLKGSVAAGAGLALGGRPAAFALGIAAVLGHMFPLYRKGGKGVATAGGMAIVLYPAITVGLLVVWALIAKLAHKASLASLVCAVAFPVLVAVTRCDTWEIAAVALVSLLLVVRHAGNIRRLVRGEESSLRAPSSPTSR